MIGADKIIVYDPPGAIGLVYPDAAVLLRFEETEPTDRPRDLADHLTDLDPATAATTLTIPAQAAAVLGAGRAFAAGTGYLATDLDPGSTLLTRDASVQAVVALDAIGAAAQDRGVLIARGQDTGVAGTGLSYAVSVVLVDAPTALWQLQWSWTTRGGLTEAVQPGALFTAPAPGAFTLLTATRRWVSPTAVELRYYVGDALIGTATSADGDIAGNILHETSVGASYDLAHAGWRHFLCGVLDEIVVLPRTLCAEEVEATWRRLTVYQPLGVRAFREQFDPGFPISADPASDAQREIAVFGQALGFVAAQIENLRANFLPTRAYGSTLEQWEQAMTVTPQPSASLEARRARVVARFRQKNGASITGIGQALADLIDTDPANLQVIAYTNTVTDGFDSVIDPVLWDQAPAGSAVAASGVARVALALGDYQMTGAVKRWRTFARPISQSIAPASGHHVIAAVTIGVATDELEAGVWWGDRAAGTYFLVGLRTSIGGTTFSVVGERFVNHASVGVIVDPASIVVGNPGKVWIHAWHDEPTGLFKYAWSTTGPHTGYAISAATIAGAPGGHWAGCYVRSLGDLTALIPLPGAGPRVDFDDFTLWTPHGVRPVSAYVYRNPLLGGAPDLAACHSVIQAIKHAYTHATLITSRAVVCDDPASGCDRGPMGAP